MGCVIVVWWIPYILPDWSMNKKSRKLEGEQPMVVMEKVALENDLRITDVGFFRNKENIAKARDTQGNRYILKTGNIEPFQIQLFQTAKSMESGLSFKVPSIVKQGEGWILFEEVEGSFLNESYEEKPDRCVELSKRIADDYQSVLQELQNHQSIGALLADGQEWLFSRLDLWSKPIVDAELIDVSLVQRLKRELEDVVRSKGEDAFGWAHGNITGEHIIVAGDDMYLLDLAAVPRVGKGYYDFLRALDYMFLQSKDAERMFTDIKRWGEEYLHGFSEGEVKLVFAFRNIGILGWDILHENVEYMRGNLEKKKQVSLKFINREY
jgi:hypothetical protein